MSFFTVQRKPNHDSFFAKVAQRRAEFGRTKEIAGRICVPPELQWWYWQEFGTAVGGKTHQVDPRGGASGRTYQIAPVNASMLKFPYGGETVYTALVKAHPGVPSHHSVSKRLRSIRDLAAINLELASIRDGFWSVAAIHDSLLTKTLPQAIEVITAQMQQDLLGTRPDGRLGGETAAHDFNTKSFIKDTTN